MVQLQHWIYLQLQLTKSDPIYVLQSCCISKKLSTTKFDFNISLFQIGEVKVPLCMVDLAQTIEEWKDIQSVKVDDQVGGRTMLIKHDIDSE